MPVPRHRLGRAGVVFGGIVALQFFLFGPSLFGHTILLPLDLLATSQFYLPENTETPAPPPHARAVSDEILSLEFNRRFAASEVRAGRLPIWIPHFYAGVPFVAWGKYSPYAALYYFWPAPETLAWLQLIKSLVAGIGAYLCFRRLFHVGFWPATIGAWCFPLTGVFMLWRGFPITFVISWLPLALLCVDQLVRRRGRFAGPKLCVVTALIIASGQIDIAAQVLIFVGLYAIWSLLDEHGGLASNSSLHGVKRSVASLSLAFALGITLTSPYWLPLLEYSGSGSRIEERMDGAEERPPQGLAALPQIVLPNVYGARQAGDHRITRGNRLESSAIAYTGLLASLLLAPLAFFCRRARSQNLFWAGSALLSLAWTLNVPGVVWLLRQPPLNILSHNRSAFIASFCLLGLAVTGLDALSRNRLGKRPASSLVPLVLLIALGTWCAARAIDLPEPLAHKITAMLANGVPVPGIPNHEALLDIRARFVRVYWQGAAASAAVALVWLALVFRPGRVKQLSPVLGLTMVCELAIFAHGLNPQVERDLYYPEIPVLAELAERAETAPGRILGIACLPPMLSQSHGLSDIRGYDGVDPAELVDLLELAAGPRNKNPDHARTMFYKPLIYDMSDKGVYLSPILDMLNVRYLVLRGEALVGFEPLLVGDDYWVMENPNALPRAFIPRTTRTIVDRAERLRWMASPQFDPRETAIVESELEAVSASPTKLGEGNGNVSWLLDTPTHIRLRAVLNRAGLVVLSDLWFEGWEAHVDGNPTRIARVNHALRGIPAPAGQSVIELRYRPAGLSWAARLAGGSVIVLLVWSFWIRHRELA